MDRSARVVMQARSLVPAAEGILSQTLARGGTAVSYGSASGPPPAIEPRHLVPRCTRLAGGALFTYDADPSELQRRAAVVVEAIQSGWLRVGQGTAYALANVAEAHRDIEGRGTQGKLYLAPEQKTP